jgi:hypothetical protein
VIRWPRKLPSIGRPTSPTTAMWPVADGGSIRQLNVSLLLHRTHTPDPKETIELSPKSSHWWAITDRNRDTHCRWCDVIGAVRGFFEQSAVREHACDPIEQAAAGNGQRITNVNRPQVERAGVPLPRRPLP